ncbi:MAG: four helix bundle protein [Oscillospiraceae bacterium]|nr:four helix bundle protein [Oscillospiraceae bacterium]MDY3064888.1 four helix bundle protein [Oscillospiraceae bacterium]
MNSPLLDKSLDFSTQIVLFYETFSKSKKDTTIAKQLLRSETSIGANINEAVYGNSKADFISKLHISLKETGESIYWLTLLKRTKLIEYDFESLLALAEKLGVCSLLLRIPQKKTSELPTFHNSANA